MKDMGRVRYILSWMMLLLIFSCEKDIEIELNDQPDQLVMYSFIYPDSIMRLHLSKSESVLSVFDYQQVTNARFCISVNGHNQGTYILPSDTVWSEWQNLVFKQGDCISIEAFEEDGDTVRVKTFLPVVVPIAEIDTSRIYYSFGEGGLEQFLKTKLTFNEPASTNDYYQLYVLREGWGQIGQKPYYTRKVVEYKKEDPVFIQKDQSGSLMQGLDFQGLFADDLINGRKYTINFNMPVDYLFFDYYEDKIKISLYLYHHTKDYYSYFRSKILSAGFEGLYEDLPIFDPVRIYNNVDGGLGLVSGMAFDVDSLVFYRR